MTFTMTFRSENKLPFLRKPLHIAYTAIFLVFLLYSGFTTPDLLNWLLENSLTLSVLIILAAFYNIFRFSDTSYTLIFLFMMLHVYGSHYQYADNPFGEWMKEPFNFQRNHYDRIVHFGFGLMLTYPLYEIAKRGFGHCSGSPLAAPSAAGANAAKTSAPVIIPVLLAKS